MSADNEKIVASDEDTKLSTSINKLSLISSDISTCDNCGKEGSNIKNICNKCKSATYCNAACKKKHRSKHKMECERRVAELQEEELECERRAAELHNEKIFKPPPPNEDCPICMLLLPSSDTGSKYRSCCGKTICCGCMYAVEKRDGGVGLCPFCRTPAPTAKEAAEQLKKRSKDDHAESIYGLGICHYHGESDIPQDHAKSLELWHRASELGHAMSSYNIGHEYYYGNGARGVERDEKKAVHYFELAAMGGHVKARHYLGALEGRAGNHGRAVKHFMIAAGFGYIAALEQIKQMFMYELVTKDDYAKALQLYQANVVEIKSVQRDEAAAYNTDRYKYY